MRLTTVLDRQGDAAGNRHVRRNTADDGKDLALVRADVHIAVASVGGAAQPAEILGQHFPRRDAADQVSGQVAVRRAEIVVRLGNDGAPGRDGFLSATGITAACNLPLTVQLELDAVLEFPHQHHVVEESAAEVRRDVRGRGDSRCSAHTTYGRYRN